MGGGGLRILGHKKWHVWRRDNMERVLRDEREHEEAQRQARDQQRRRDQERRADALGASAAPPTETHINFFEREEQAHKTERHRQPQAVETLGRQGKQPWYASSTAASTEEELNPKRKRHVTVAPCFYGKLTTLVRRTLETQDPLRAMRPPRDANDREADDDEDERVRRRHAKRRRTDEKKEKKLKKKRKIDDDARETMAHLRRERHEREAIERERAERLMRGH